jgi:hypothetical protein
MRKAFDANVPKLKPRLKLGAPAAVAEEAAELPLSPTATSEAIAAAPLTAIPTPTATATVSPLTHPEGERAGRGGPTPIAAATPTPAPTRSDAQVQVQDQVQVQVQDQDQDQVQIQVRSGVGEDVLSRRERLEKIKRKVAEAARPQPRVHPVPADPARAAESILGLVRDLESELVRAREREEALRADLDDARREHARAAGEGRTAAERLAATEKELEEKRSVLGDLLGEMQALEEERDESVRRAQALSSLDEERARLLEDLGKRADEEGKLRAEREAEVERLSEELRLAGTEGARLRAAIGELARERDVLGADLDRVRKERDDLAEAKKALEAVHAALAQARARIG